jgi:hypothetical protein
LILRRKTERALKICWTAGSGALDAGGVLISKKGSTTMNTPCIEQSQAELSVIKGFEGEDIEVSVEQLETRLMPESTAGFLE